MDMDIRLDRRFFMCFFRVSIAFYWLETLSIRHKSIFGTVIKLPKFLDTVENEPQEVNIFLFLLS